MAPRQESLLLAFFFVVFLCSPPYSGLEDISSRCQQGVLPEVHQQKQVPAFVEPQVLQRNILYEEFIHKQRY